jgi:hypothetical protein
MVKDHYTSLGFHEDDKFFILDTLTYEPKTTYITENNKINV